MKLKDAMLLACKKYGYPIEYHIGHITWNLPPGQATVNKSYIRRIKRGLE